MFTIHTSHHFLPFARKDCNGLFFPLAPVETPPFRLELFNNLALRIRFSTGFRIGTKPVSPVPAILVWGMRYSGTCLRWGCTRTVRRSVSWRREWSSWGFSSKWRFRAALWRSWWRSSRVRAARIPIRVMARRAEVMR